MKLYLNDLPKYTAPPWNFQQRIKEYIEKIYKGQNNIYTDVSKSEIGVAATPNF